MIMDNITIRLLHNPLKHDQNHGFTALVINNLTIRFFSPNFTSIVQPMDKSIIDSFKMHYKANFKLQE
jgi:hypothetical protein